MTIICLTGDNRCAWRILPHGDSVSEGAHYAYIIRVFIACHTSWFLWTEVETGSPALWQKRLWRRLAVIQSSTFVLERVRGSMVCWSWAFTHSYWKKRRAHLRLFARSCDHTNLYMTYEVNWSQIIKSKHLTHVPQDTVVTQTLPHPFLCFCSLHFWLCDSVYALRT